MVETRMTSDPRSRDIVRMGYDAEGRRTETRIGAIQWHAEREPSVVLRGGPDNYFPSLSISETDVLLAELKERVIESRQTPAAAA